VPGAVNRYVFKSHHLPREAGSQVKIFRPDLPASSLGCFENTAHLRSGTLSYAEGSSLNCCIGARGSGYFLHCQNIALEKVGWAHEGMSFRSGATGECLPHLKAGPMVRLFSCREGPFPEVTLRAKILATSEDTPHPLSAKFYPFLLSPWSLGLSPSREPAVFDHSSLVSPITFSCFCFEL
jgi:hypothetical protein